MNIQTYIGNLSFPQKISYKDSDFDYNKKSYFIDFRYEFCCKEHRLTYAIYFVNKNHEYNECIAKGFVSEDRNCTLVQIAGESYLSSSMLDNLLASIRYKVYEKKLIPDLSYYFSDVCLVTETSVGETQTFFGCINYPVKELNCENLYSTVLDYQRKISLNKCHTKKRKLLGMYDAILQKVPKETDGFHKWLEYSFMPLHRYFFYTFQKTKFIKGVCSVCGSTISMPRQVNGATGVCPVCHKNLVYRSANRNTTILARSTAVYPMYKNGVLYIRIYGVYKSFLDLKQKVDLYPIHLIVIDKTQTYYFTKKYLSFDNSWRYWFDSDTINEIEYTLKWCEKSQFYLPSIVESFIESKLPNYQDNTPNLGIRSLGSALFLSSAANASWVLESLYKIGNNELFTGLFRNFSKTYSWRQTTGKRNLYKELKISRKFKSIVPTMDMLLLDTAQCVEKRHINISIKDLIAAHEKGFYGEDIALVARLGYQNMKAYIETQTLFCDAMDNKRDERKIWLLYRDYLKWILENNDLTEEEKKKLFKPANVMIAHDKIKYSDKKCFSEKAMVRAINQYKNYYCFEDENYIVVPPKSSEDFYTEGAVLSHCVCRYMQDVERGEKIIMFLRRKEEPDIPFYTLECFGNKIVQCGGFDNRNASQQVMAFLERYKKYLAEGVGNYGVYSENR